jgi:hypothetical protein
MTHFKSLLHTGYIANCHDLSHTPQITSPEKAHDTKSLKTAKELDIAYILHILNCFTKYLNKTS